METESPTVQQPSAGDDILIPRVYEDPTKGLRKERLSFRYTSMDKPTELSRCLLIIRDVNDIGSHESNYLTGFLQGTTSKEQWLTMGSAITPIDCYVEHLLQQMLTNEESKCSIRTKANEVTFTMKLLRIEGQRYFYEHDVKSALDLAKRYKENGVKMFSKYPLFAHAYFNRAAKCLLSWVHIEDLDLPAEGNCSKKEFKSLLETLQLNIAACLIKETRFDDVLHVLRYTEEQENPSLKAIYRKALAHYKLKQFTEALAALQRIDYALSKECVELHKQIIVAQKQDNNKYNTMIRNMFG